MGFTYDEEENFGEYQYQTDKVSEWIERNREFYDNYMYV